MSEVHILRGIHQPIRTLGHGKSKQMKKVKRNPEKFGTLELFTAVASERGYDLRSSGDRADFIEKIRISIEKSAKNNIEIFGKRTESLFAYVAGALNKVALLKQEDSGDVYTSGCEVRIPDYKLTMRDGSQFFVEVKNCHMTNFRHKFFMETEYYDKLKAYSDLNKIELKFAVYFHGPNAWSLLQIESFDKKESGYTIDFINAMAKSEMSYLGDCMIATKSNLEIQLLADHEEASVIGDDGNDSFIRKSTRIYCAGNEVTDSEEIKLALYFIRFGDWFEIEKTRIVLNGKLLGMKLTFYPCDAKNKGISVIGNLSSMVSNAFREHTVEDGEVVALAPGINPSELGILIPDNYSGSGLPLWRIRVQPNPDFQSTSKHG